MKQKQLRGLFSLGQSRLWYEMKTEKVENRRWRKESFSWSLIFEKANRILKRKELFVLKDLILQEHYLWGHKFLLAYSKKCWNPFRTETQETLGTCHKSAWLWLNAVGAMPVYTLCWELSPSCLFWAILYSTGFYDFMILYSSGLFWWRKCKSFWSCHLSKWEILQYFYSGGTWPVLVGNQFYSISFFFHMTSLLRHAKLTCKCTVLVVLLGKITLHWSQAKAKA